MRGIHAAGVYVPQFRVSADAVEDVWGTFHAGGVDAKAVPAADEDAVTMAMTAAERALDDATVTCEGLAFVGLATTTPPLEEEALAPRVAKALGAPDNVATRSSTQSTLAGAHVLEAALNTTGPALAIAADAPRGDPAEADHAFGAGAAAFVITDDPAVTVHDVASFTDERPGMRYRRQKSETVESIGITTYERTAVRDAVTTAIERLEGASDDFHAAALYQPNGKLPYRTTGDLPIDAETVSRGIVVDRIGDAGAAGVPLGLAAALETAKSDDYTVAGFFGSGGGSTAMLFEGRLPTDTTADLDAGTQVSYSTYLRERGYVVDADVAGGGAHVSLPSWQRSLDQRYRLRAGRCPECRALAFPPEGTCPDCHASVEFAPVELPRTGEIAALTSIGQGGAPPEFIPQQQRDGGFGVAIVEMTVGDESVTLPAQITGVDPETLEIGNEVRAVVRRIYEQEGIPRYGVKFTDEA